MFEPLNLNPLSNAGHIEHFDLLHHIITTQAPQPLPNPVQMALGRTTDLNDATRKLHKRDKFVDESEKARSHDADRDRYTGVMARLWDVLADFPPGPIQEAGKTLHRHLRLFGTVEKITKQDGRAESTDIKRILEDQQSKPELRAAREVVAFADPLIDALDASNTAYTAAMAARSQKNVDQDIEPGAMKKLRDDMRKPYHELLETVWSYYISTERSEPWAKVVKLIEELKDETRQRFAVKQGRADAKAEKTQAKPGA
ncbi:DUF6261 family protein [Flaviaesturariibacter terrae]